MTKLHHTTKIVPIVAFVKCHYRPIWAIAAFSILANGGYKHHYCTMTIDL